MKTKSSRVDIKWEKQMREIMRKRINKRLTLINRNEIGIPATTKLMMNCPSWNKLIKEMETMPLWKRRKKK